jgi:predicted RNA-binding Zn-ribbon protein involved in translation (DUF1610 family)
MKTKEDYLKAVNALRTAGKWGALIIILTMGAALFFMGHAQVVSQYTGRPFAIGLYFAVQLIVPAVAFWLTWKLKSLTKKADLSCPICGKPLVESGRDLKKIVIANRCPACGNALYPI